MTYFDKEVIDVLDELKTDRNGLSVEDVKERQKQGYNELNEAKKDSLLIMFLGEFKDFLIIILIIAATISGVFGESKSAITIFVVVMINAILGMVQRLKAESSIEDLKKLSSPVAKVIRNGVKEVIPARELVVGDIVLLDSGDNVPADGRLIESASLQSIESALTGESSGVEKTAQPIFDIKTSLGDMRNMVFASSLISHGRGVFVVTNIGMDTEVGKIASLLQNAKERKTPLQERLDDFGKKLGVIIILISVIIFAINLYRGAEFIDSFMFAVALSVAAIPEALSSIVTIVLSIGTKRMSEKNAIIKKLPAVETLGAASIICSDKTGTLTQNKMTVLNTYTANGENNTTEEDSITNKLIQISVLANDGVITSEGVHVGDPTETCLIEYAKKFSIIQEAESNLLPRLAELPFDSDRKLMSTVHEVAGQYYLFTKGAPDVLLSRADKVITKDGIKALEDEVRNSFIEKNEEYSTKGLRVLAFAMRLIDEKEIGLDHENEMILVGLIAMMDPPRDEVKGAVKKAVDAGVKTIMITGDHKITAKAIATELGILNEGDLAIDSMEFAQMTENEYLEKIEKIRVYARVSPEDKIRIVQAWQNKGEIVAMTGDGVNDAPALKQADIGVAMGITGTDVSKDAAAMVLLDDNFATIIEAIAEGRTVYTNIKKSIQFLLSGNTAAIITVLYAVILALPNPFSALHLLFINLVTDSLPAISMAFEKQDKNIMEEKPRLKNESIFARGMGRDVLLQGVVIGIVTIIGFVKGLNSGDLATAQTMAFAILCISRLVHGFTVRSKQSIFKDSPFSNKMMCLSFGIGLFLQILVLKVPFLMEIFDVVELNLNMLSYVIVLPVISLFINDLVKFAFNKISTK